VVKTAELTYYVLLQFKKAWLYVFKVDIEVGIETGIESQYGLSFLISSNI
jgi:hypothetical protein